MAIILNDYPSYKVNPFSQSCKAAEYVSKREFVILVTAPKESKTFKEYRGILSTLYAVYGEADLGVVFLPQQWADEASFQTLFASMPWAAVRHDSPHLPTILGTFQFPSGFCTSNINNMMITACRASFTRAAGVQRYMYIVIINMSNGRC